MLFLPQRHIVWYRLVGCSEDSRVGEDNICPDRHAYSTLETRTEWVNRVDGHGYARVAARSLKQREAATRVGCNPVETSSPVGTGRRGAFVDVHVASRAGPPRRTRAVVRRDTIDTRRTMGTRCIHAFVDVDLASGTRPSLETRTHQPVSRFHTGPTMLTWGRGARTRDGHIAGGPSPLDRTHTYKRRSRPIPTRSPVSTWVGGNALIHSHITDISGPPRDAGACIVGDLIHARPPMPAR